MTYNTNSEYQQIDHFDVEDGHLIAFYKEGEEMAKVDLGQVVGPQGAKGATGATGPAGKDGISPTFSIEGGHLYADYDNPYTPEIIQAGRSSINERSTKNSNWRS